LLVSPCSYVALIVLVAAQIRARVFRPSLYWATIVAATTFGTAMADFADRSLGIGYTGGSSLLFICLMASLGFWYWSEGTIAVNTVAKPKVEAFYWVAITVSQTLGTALGDWLADTGGVGYEGGALVFGAALVVIAGLYFWSSLSRVGLFWAAFILTRPLGATVGDFLDKPVHNGGLALSRPLASAVIAVFIIAGRLVVGFCRPPLQIALVLGIGGTACEFAKASGAMSEVAGMGHAAGRAPTRAAPH
jgi:uncharacterized membrane-anchored protein